mgnify:CR=1 FL=1
MFPRSLLLFIFIMVIDLILKSMKDKKIEQGRKAKPTDVPQIKRKEVIVTQAPKVQQPKTRGRDMVNERSLEMQSLWEEPVSFEPSKEIIKPKIEDKVYEDKTKKSKEEFKKELLRGIIYSEILSKPKSLRNTRKSI